MTGPSHVHVEDVDLGFEVFHFFFEGSGLGFQRFDVFQKTLPVHLFQLFEIDIHRDSPFQKQTPDKMSGVFYQSICWYYTITEPFLQ